MKYSDLQAAAKPYERCAELYAKIKPSSLPTLIAIALAAGTAYVSSEQRYELHITAGAGIAVLIIAKMVLNLLINKSAGRKAKIRKISEQQHPFDLTLFIPWYISEFANTEDDNKIKAIGKDAEKLFTAFELFDREHYHTFLQQIRDQGTLPGKKAELVCKLFEEFFKFEPYSAELSRLMQELGDAFIDHLVNHQFAEHRAEFAIDFAQLLAKHYQSSETAKALINRLHDPLCEYFEQDSFDSFSLLEHDHCRIAWLQLLGEDSRIGRHYEWLFQETPEKLSHYELKQLTLFSDSWQERLFNFVRTTQNQEMLSRLLQAPVFNEFRYILMARQDTSGHYPDNALKSELEENWNDLHQLQLIKQYLFDSAWMEPFRFEINSRIGELEHQNYVAQQAHEANIAQQRQAAFAQQQAESAQRAAMAQELQAQSSAAHARASQKQARELERIRRELT